MATIEVDPSKFSVTTRREFERMERIERESRKVIFAYQAMSPRLPLDLHVALIRLGRAIDPMFEPDAEIA